jgi:hypothetical protein
VALPGAPPSKGRSLDGLVIRVDLLKVLHPSIYAHDLLLLHMALHLVICGYNLFLMALHLLLLLFLWT